MPYEQKTLPINVASNHDELVSDIAAEFSRPAQRPLSSMAMGVYRDPFIVEQPIGDTDRLEVYVVWDKWLGIEEKHRTAAIVDAYKHGPEPDKAKRLVVALGFTPAEARNFGLLG